MKRILGLIFITLMFVCGDFAPCSMAQTRQQKTSQTTKKKQTKKSSTSKKKNTSVTKSSSKPRTATEVKQAKQRTANEIRETKRKIQLNTQETEQRLNQLNLLEGEITVCNTNIGKINANIDSINVAIKSTSDSIQVLDNRMNAIKDQYVKAVRRSQGYRHHTSMLAFIFSSNSFSQAYRRARSLQQFSKWRQRRSDEISEIRLELDVRRNSLTSLKQQVSAQANKLNAEKKNLLKKQSETSQLVNRLKQEGGELNHIMRRRQREAELLDAELDRVIVEEAARQEKLRKEREEAERKARFEAEQKAREEEEARKAAEEADELKRIAEAEAQAAREAEAKAEAARKAEAQAKAKADEAERIARESADKEAKELAKKEREEAKKAQEAREKAEKEAKKRAKEAEKQADRERNARKVKPVKHKGKNNQREKSDASSATEITTNTAANAPTLRSAAANGESGIAPKADTPIGGSFEDYRGKLPFPVTGHYTIVKRFGRQKHPTLPHVETTNSGIDMQTDPGTTVRSVFDGEVSAVFRPDGYNNVIVIRHGKFMTVYANLGTITVSTGQKVKAGEPLGTVFTDVNDSNRSVLHFEIRNQRQKENPELWLKH